jgi:hypothetical protein
MYMTKQRVRLLLASMVSLGIVLLMSSTVAAHTIVRTIPAHASVLKCDTSHWLDHLTGTDKGDRLYR